MARILVLNPGSTSTKVAVYEGRERLWLESIPHSTAQLAAFPRVWDQLEFRSELLAGLLKRRELCAADFDAIAARGGLLCPVQGGAYRVNEAMLDMLEHRPSDEHASNLAAPMAAALAKEAGIPAYIYDGVTVDEMLPLVQLTGLKGVRRVGRGHNLNMRAVAHRYADETGRALWGLTLLVAHLGGGISVSAISGGKIVDMLSDQEGPFSPERIGGLPNEQMMDFFIQNGCDRAATMKQIKTRGGLVSYFGTSDCREIEARIDAGDAEAALVYEAMALNVAKNLAKMAVSVSGRVDAVILTGGSAHSQRLTGWISQRVRFIAPVVVYPGEDEMQALAYGVARVLSGEEQAREFSENTLPSM